MRVCFQDLGHFWLDLGLFTKGNYRYFWKTQVVIDSAFKNERVLSKEATVLSSLRAIEQCFQKKNSAFKNKVKTRVQ